ncbi:MAG TPA: Gfo/Idh/MocA family oxidoreductase [Terriglobales bacterium]|jgi:predicted dehydrogenase|nr:Gfo/Idh/MocA family oxidoreductase [Terriglobales bacterium]
MKGLVVGCGSIGHRHLRNLKSLGVSDLGFVESDRERRESAASELGVASFALLTEGLRWTPDFVLIATPTHLHIEQAIEVATHGCAFFVEKPLSHTPEGIAELLNAIQRHGLISMVGCNMRFHPAPRKIKELLDQRRLGKLLCARIHSGFYLPAWRPGTDYRMNYAAREETGGGCILDCIHEIDLARWYLGDVVDVFCAAGHLSSLEIATEDVAVLVSRHASGVLSEVHLDYVQRSYERGCQIAGEDGSLSWDFREKQVRWYDAVSDHWETFEQPADWQLNQMYIDEMRHFLDCVQERKETMLPVADAARVMEFVFAAKQSASERRVITLNWDVTA